MAGTFKFVGMSFINRNFMSSEFAKVRYRVQIVLIKKSKLVRLKEFLKIIEVVLFINSMFKVPKKD